MAKPVETLAQSLDNLPDGGRIGSNRLISRAQFSHLAASSSAHRAFRALPEPCIFPALANSLAQPACLPLKSGIEASASTAVK
jgi:hypothetical protein